MATENKNLSQYDKSTLPNPKDFKIGIITSEWNEQVTHGMREGAINTLKDCGVEPENIINWSVPGSFELVHAAKRMLDTTTADAIISHLNAVQSDVPVIFCVLTDNTLQQSLDRSGGKLGNKGVEAAVTALKMVAVGRE